MKKYLVSFSLYGRVVVEARNKDDAREQVENMDSRDLVDCLDGVDEYGLMPVDLSDPIHRTITCLSICEEFKCQVKVSTN